MSNIKRILGIAVMSGLAMFGTANADEIIVTEDIAVSTTWTADNVYNMQNQIFVLPGATLTIEAGTVIASETGVGGSLVVTRGAQIFVNGTQENPVIMTSTADVETWEDDPNHPTGKDPKTGTWREGVNEWGNLTILGNGLISGSHFDGEPIEVTIDQDGDPATTDDVITRTNTKVPDGLNRRQMEGLTAAFTGDPKVLFGGGDDDDDSGSISYLSLRYTGRVIGLGNELNGLSMGGIGRETDVDHVETMNNVDDGIETWGGTVNYKYVSVWNVGDDSIDIDQGWRGKAQFGLIVQGFSTNADQGSGVGDNCFETDGAEDSDAQPVTTSTIYNFTVVGQPIDGDGGTTWRDNVRIQYRNCIFMDLGDQLVKFDNDDGDGGNGYGFNGTLSWEDTWTTPYTETSSVNIGNANADELYTVQTSGNLAEITDSVFFNIAEEDFSEADARGVRDAENNNVTADSMPIRGLTRDEAVIRGPEDQLVMQRVLSINPSAANDATTSADTAPDDGFFTPAQYRGGFSPNPSENWLLGWTAADAFGMVSQEGASSVSNESWSQLK